MPQICRHRPPRIVDIEFESNQKFENPPMSNRVTLVLITQGRASFVLNKKAVTLTAPSIMLLSQYDEMKLEEYSRLAAKSFSFIPGFLNYNLTFERLANNDFIELSDEHDRNLMNLFLKRDEYYDGTMDLPPQTYLRISEWLAIMGTETSAQSDGMWTCRIRRYLLQTLYLLEDIYAGRKLPGTIKREKSQIDLVLEYVHTNYASEITLDALCKVAHLNRTSLNRKFKAQVGRTAMDYVLSHRIKIATEALSHTKLSLSEISEAIGFKHDTYFIRQFTAKMGVSPTEYRRNIWGER